MSGKIEISREQLEYWCVMLRSGLPDTVESMIQTVIAAPVVKRQPTGQWRISVNGDWFYGTKEQCERERAEYETTFTAEDYAEAGAVVPEQIWSSPPAPVADEMVRLLTRARIYARGEFRDEIDKCLLKAKRMNK